MANTTLAEAVSFSFLILFVISGFIVNLVQAICFVLIRPLSKNIHRRINQVVTKLLWLEVVWLVDWWAGVKIQVHTDDPEAMTRFMGKENAIVISNYITHIDHTLMSVLAHRCGSVGKVVSSKLVKFVPTIGWWMWFSDNIFLERINGLGPDQDTSALCGLKDFPLPIWLNLFPRGIGKEKMSTEVFVSTVKRMRPFTPAVYDVTIACNSDQPPSLARQLLRKRPSYVVHMHIKRHDIIDLPNEDDAVGQWCEDVFLAKHALLEQHRADQTFGDHQTQLESCSKPPPLDSIWVVTSWALLFTFCALKFTLWSLLVLLISSSGLFWFLKFPFLSLLLLEASSRLFLLCNFPLLSSAATLITSSGCLYLLLHLNFPIWSLRGWLICFLGLI
ncbi:putative 1-acylglycerol-3-phosphate O-acyltransferase [Rosa chinensis]|uniref:1-acylglycerol-3-phosphate O-acyltransferase n=1 Tax=Rosa chinensis TaxID=74649 RepID=A0A2P6QRP5_ROSCH|nr:putative 1-acylglycerol-3-phosphate O-acyltransferase [Rosa chinensis]